MDPNTALQNLRRLFTQLDGEGTKASGETINELIDTFAGLDGWLSSGGFLPDDWSKGRG